jgi:hypothetical protein
MNMQEIDRKFDSIMETLQNEVRRLPLDTPFSVPLAILDLACLVKLLLRERADRLPSGEVEFHPSKVKPMLDPAEQAVEDFEDHIDAQQQVGLHRASFEVSGKLVKGASVDVDALNALKRALCEQFGLPEGDYVILQKAEHERLLQAERDLEQLRSRR